jgi:hypothetical protein
LTMSFHSPTSTPVMRAALSEGWSNCVSHVLVGVEGEEPGAGWMTYVGPCVLHHLLAGGQERLQQTPRLDHQLMASLLVLIGQLSVQGIDVLDQGRHGSWVARPGSEREINGVGHGGRVF